MLCIITGSTYVLEKYNIDYRDLMKTNMFSLVAILSIVAVMTTSTVMPVLALGDTVQQIRTELDGFTVMSGCCTVSAVHVEGNLITTSDGNMELSSQNGVLTIGTVSYELKFVPTSKMSITSETDVCASGTSYEQLGDVELTGNDGSVLKGLGVYSWGNALGCHDGDSSFTY